MSTDIILTYIKILRKKTGAGFYTCKQALIKNNYNLSKSISYIKQNETIYKKIIDKKLNEGLLLQKIINIGCNKLIFFIELNCETDFVAKNKLFLLYSHKIIKFVIKHKIFTQKKINIYLKKFLLKLNNKFDELIKINRLNFLIHKNINFYNHNRRILVIATYNIKNKDSLIHNDVMKKLTMHIAAQKPIFITYKDIPKSIIKTFYEKELVSIKKSKNIIKKIRANKFKLLANEICFVKQKFIFDGSRLIENVMITNNIFINNYMYIELCKTFIFNINKNINFLIN